MPARKQTKKTESLKVYREDRFGRKHPLDKEEAAAIEASATPEPAAPQGD